MSLQPGINPLDRPVPAWGPNPYRIGRKPTRPPVQNLPAWGPGPGQRYSFPTRDGSNEALYTDPRNDPNLYPQRNISAEEARRKRTGNEALHTDPRTDPNLYPQRGPGFRTMEYKYGRDESPLRTLEYKYGRDESKPELLGGSSVWGPGPGERARYQNTGGFDATDLMAKPEIKQEETRNQANMVSAPYEEANRKAAGKTNPMNAASQEPGMAFLMKYVGK